MVLIIFKSENYSYTPAFYLTIIFICIRTFLVVEDRHDISTACWSVRVGDSPSADVKPLDWEQYDTVELKLILVDRNNKPGTRATDEGTRCFRFVFEISEQLFVLEYFFGSRFKDCFLDNVFLEFH